MWQLALAGAVTNDSCLTISVTKINVVVSWGGGEPSEHCVCCQRPIRQACVPSVLLMHFKKNLGWGTKLTFQILGGRIPHVPYGSDSVFIPTQPNIHCQKASMVFFTVCNNCNGTDTPIEEAEDYINEEGSPLLPTPLDTDDDKEGYINHV
ncbi:hypothetical protein J6590_019256 [Homalodisca vitripennis]|nr:hypothetical protein J6590_019256 [Homalodisca vitripennis]